MVEIEPDPRTYIVAKLDGLGPVELVSLLNQIDDFEKGPAGRFFKQVLREAFHEQLNDLRSDQGEEKRRIQTAQANARADVFEALLAPGFGFKSQIEERLRAQHGRDNPQP